MVTGATDQLNVSSEGLWNMLGSLLLGSMQTLLEHSRPISYQTEPILSIYDILNHQPLCHKVK